jgi:hypothetical protein
VSRTPADRLIDISQAAAAARRAVAALERAEADGTDDEARLHTMRCCIGC